MNPAIVLVPSAFSESKSWNDVVDAREGAGHPVIAAANPLRDLAIDAGLVGGLVRSIERPVVLLSPAHVERTARSAPGSSGRGER